MPTEQPLSIDFRQEESIEQLLSNRPLVNSHQSSWNNIHLAHYRETIQEVPEMSSPQHIVVIPIGPHVLDMEFFSEGRFQDLPVREQDYQNGMIQIFPADLLFNQRSMQGSVEVEFIHCYLEPTYFAQVAHESVNPDRVELLLQRKRYDPLIRQISMALRADLEEDETGNGFYADSLATAMCAHLLQHYSTRKHIFREYDDGLSKRQFQQAIDYINAHLDGKPSLNAIANELGMSQYYFCRLFKRSTGMTAHQYLTQQRVERAKQLLRGTKMTITEIALECGFTHQSHFAKYFRQSTGVTPNQFRQS
jgi:AraC family transcriptional regulator